MPSVRGIPPTIRMLFYRIGLDLNQLMDRPDINYPAVQRKYTFTYFRSPIFANMLDSEADNASGGKVIEVRDEGEDQIVFKAEKVLKVSK